MASYFPFYDPCEMLAGLHGLEPRVVRSLPREFVYAPPMSQRYYRRRPGFYIMVDDHSQEKSELEKEENFNENCSACMSRKGRKVVHKKNEAEVTHPMSLERHEKNIQIEKVEDDQKFVLRLDVNGFEPDNVQVKIKDGWLEVDAKCEEKNESSGMYSFRQLHRRFALPAHVNPDLVTSSLNKDGYLSIETSSSKPALTSQQEENTKPEGNKSDSISSRQSPAVPALASQEDGEVKQDQLAEDFSNINVNTKAQTTVVTEIKGDTHTSAEECLAA